MALPCLKDNSETSKKSPSQVWPLQKSLIPHQILKESHKSISITIAFSVGVNQKRCLQVWLYKNRQFNPVLRWLHAWHHRS